MVASLTAAHYDFMLGTGWRPLGDPAGGWPSGLALGPHGWAMSAAFAVSGLLLMAFASGLHRGATGGRGSPTGPALLFVAGLAMSLMAFETDPIRRAGPRSWPGLVHDAAFVVFALALLLALFLLSQRFERDASWRRHGRYTLATALLCAACLVLPGVAYYLFLVAALLWVEVTAIRLRRVSRRQRASSSPRP